jgi:hypothetical protein
LLIGAYSDDQFGGGSGVDFALIRLSVDGTATKTNRWTTLTVVDGTGTPRVYTAASALGFTNSSNRQMWTWGDGLNPVWAQADDTEVRGLTIIV